jgi:hypothetical protein
MVEEQQGHPTFLKTTLRGVILSEAKDLGFERAAVGRFSEVVRANLTR